MDKLLPHWGRLKRQAKVSAQHDDAPERKLEGLAAIFLGKMKGAFRNGGKEWFFIHSDCIRSGRVFNPRF